MGRLTTICAAVAWTVGVLVASAQAQPADDAYRGKTLNIYSGNSAGGAYSAYARLLERHIGKYMPGHPAAVLKFMDGAGGLTFANWLYTQGPRDGLTFGIFPQRMAIEPLVSPNPAIAFDGRKFSWIGSMAKQAGVCFTWHSSNVRTVEDARRQAATVGSSGSSSADAVMPRIMNSLLATKFQVIGGYGGADILLAMERAEVDGRCGFGWASLKTTKPEWISEKKIHVLTQFSLKPHPELPDVPLMIDLVEDQQDRRALELFFAPEEMGRPFAAPPEVPGPRVTVLRQAFAKVTRDADLLVDAAKMQLEIDPIAGEQIHELLAAIYDAPPEIAKRVTGFRNLGAGERKN